MVMKVYRYSLFIIIFLLIIFPYTCALTEPNLSVIHDCGSNLIYASDYYACGNDLVDQGNYKKAITFFKTARSMDERFFEQHYGVSYQIGWLLNRLGRYDEALVEFQKSEKNHPEWINDYAIYYDEGCLLAKLGRNEEALHKFDQALVIQYYNTYALFNKGIVLSRLGRYSDARDAFEKSRKAYGSFVPRLGSYREAANTYLDAAGISHPVNLPSPVVTSSPSSNVQPTLTYMQELSVDLQIRKANDFMAKYQFDDAVRAYDQVLINDPANYHAMEGKGVALANLGRLEEAVTSLDRAILYLDYNQDESTYIDAWFVKGWALANLGKYDESILAFNKALVIEPDAFNVHYDKAWVLAQQKQYTAAAAEYNRSLDWENQQRLDIRSASILAPLGTYQDAADAIDKATTTPAATLSPKITETLIYQTDFSSEPHWQTDRPRQYYWDSGKQMYHFRSDENLGYAEMPVAYDDSSFRLEFDITIPHADPGTIARIGLSRYNKTYDADNAIMADFHSWRAGTFRQIKDGDKLFQIFAIDAVKHVTDPEYQGACWINREDNKANATYGEGRIYHVIINYDRDKDTITTQVTDNQHTQNYYVCSGLWNKLGFFRGMDRIILVARQEPNAYIEGYIDNVKLYTVDTSDQAFLPVTTASTPPMVTPTELVNVTVQPVTPVPTPDNPPAVIPTGLILALLLIAGIAGTGIYFWKNRDMTHPQEIRKQKLQNLKIRVLSQFRNLEFFSEFVSPYLMRYDRLMSLETFNEAEDLLHAAEKMATNLKTYEDRARAWRDRGYDISLLVRTTMWETIAQDFATFESRVALLRELQKDLDTLIRHHTTIENDPDIARRIGWIRKNLVDTTKVDTVTGEIGELHRLSAEYEKEAIQAKMVQDELEYITVRISELTLFPKYVESLFTCIQQTVSTRKFSEGLEILKRSKPVIENLKKLELEYRGWKNRGFTENLPSAFQEDTYEGILARFEHLRERIAALENNTSRYETLKKTYPAIIKKPQFAPVCTRIERALQDPEDLNVAETIVDLEQKIRDSISVSEELESRVRFQAQKVTSGSGIRQSTQRSVEPVQKSIASADFEAAETMLRDLALHSIDELKGQIGQARQKGIVLALTTELAESAIGSRNYGDAIVEAEKRLVQITRISDVFAKAQDLKNSITDPALLSIFNQGNYAEFITLAREQVKEREQIELVRNKARGVLIQAQKIGNVPRSMEERIQSSDPGEIESLIKELEEFRDTARPRLELSLDHKQLEVNVWHRVRISVRNNGGADALDVNFTFSPEFNTKWIRPKPVPAGEMVVFENIAIHPNKKGEVPLEITITFQDGNNRSYTEKSEFFIDVVDAPHYTPQPQGEGGAQPQTPTNPDPHFPAALRKLFRDETRIGKGGFAYVFRVIKILDQKAVAVKVPISIDASTGKTFVTEMQNWTKMVHENIVRLYDYNIMPVAYFEMELCDGSLAKIQKPMNNEKAAWFLFHICEGLKYAHGQNIIHRDLKPQNILLKNGVPKISDWGLSRVIASQSSTVISGSYTLYYAAPEQVNKRKQDARTDLWQLGVIFYELTTGTLPFKEETVTDTLISIATKNPPPPGQINPDAALLDAIVMRCLEKDPQKRYQSALELQKDLGQFLKMNYINSLSESLISRDYGHSAEFCADLILVNLKTGNLLEAYKYAMDLAGYTSGDLKHTAEEFAEQLRMRMEEGFTDVREELIKKADIIAHMAKRQRK